MRVVGHPTLMSTDFGWAWPHVWVGGSYEAREETHGMGDLQGMQRDEPQLIRLSPTSPKHLRTDSLYYTATRHTYSVS